MLRLAARRVAPFSSSAAALKALALPSSCSSTAVAHGALLRAFSSAPLQFDTHKVVTSLRDKGLGQLQRCCGWAYADGAFSMSAGFSTEQSEAILEVMKFSMEESLDAQARIVRVVHLCNRHYHHCGRQPHSLLRFVL